MRYKNNSGSTLQFSLRPDPWDFMVLVFCAVAVLKDCPSRAVPIMMCKCRLTAESGPSLYFESYGCDLNKTDQMFGSEQTITWFATVKPIYSKYKRASFEFSPILLYERGYEDRFEDREGVISSSVVRHTKRISFATLHFQRFRNQGGGGRGGRTSELWIDQTGVRITEKLLLEYCGECRSSSAVVIKCGVHVLYDDNDINLPSFIDSDTPSESLFPDCYFNDTEIKEDEEEEEEEEEEEQVNCGLIKRKWGNRSVFEYSAMYRVDGGELPQRMRLTAESGRSLCFESYGRDLNKTDQMFGSEQTITWFSTVKPIYSKYSYKRASFEFYPTLLYEFGYEDGYEDQEGVISSSVVVIKCGVHVLYDDNDINLPSFIDSDTPSESLLPHCSFNDFEIKEEEEEEEEQVNCGLIKRV
ncbi:conserved hypothetical protein [Ricinus communis]|uniref:Uncharacterized protein n=1 Tax=Ricinus communis TaxID=3988 RepID=B9S9E1_RICCO|nr:conserved hypothetical protein [Ricinus communis]